MLLTGFQVVPVLLICAMLVTRGGLESSSPLMLSFLQWCCCLGLESLARQAGSRMEVWSPFGSLSQD